MASAQWRALTWFWAGIGGFGATGAAALQAMGPLPVATPPQAQSDASAASSGGMPVPVKPEPVPTEPRLGGLGAVTSAPVRAPPATNSSEPGPILSFRGPVMNQTMHQGGKLALQIRRLSNSDVVTIEFHASAGLIGTGKLTGTISRDGRISAVGRLLMGRNPFDCVLRATSQGEVLTGDATFTHAGARRSTYSTFTLARHT